MPSGILLVDKDEGPSSHAVVARARRYFGIKRVGHAGTLDPMATGLLVVLVGRATRLSQFLVLDEKSYEAEIAWGTATDTMDRLGDTVATHDGRLPDKRAIERALRAMTGARHQVPPMYSAKKSAAERCTGWRGKVWRSNGNRSPWNCTSSA
ncbi:MAG: hypothetical protein M5R36_04860 [Deltaproteobacteria bacterium]|nr:hypothetical protein [Deltaproteobacteria bacterium]